jgi:HD-GYP domain-containing protein (c-di-GMP phosphodiesterase class II)
MHRIHTENKNALIIAMRCLYAKCIFLYKHSILTANLAREIVLQTDIDFRLNENEAYEAGILHDIGKIAVSDTILTKNTVLNQREQEIVRRHPLWGCDQIQGTVFEKYSDIILKHHERIDGTGYPLGIHLSDGDIDIKLIAFTDQLSAYLENRPYRRTTYNDKMLGIEINQIASGNFQNQEQLLIISKTAIKIATSWHKKHNIFAKYEKMRYEDVEMIPTSAPSKTAPTLSVLKAIK